MATGRTPSKYFKFQIDDGTAVRDIPVSTIAGVGLTYEEIDVTCLQDAIKKCFNGQGNFSITIGGPFSNDAAVAASGTGARPTLSGSHTVLNAINGVNTARSFGAYFGIQADWSTGDPVFGGVDCCFVTDYTVDAASTTYTAKLCAAANGTNEPAWGTAAIAASS